MHVRGKWRIGFVATRVINSGVDVVWDYGVREEELGWEKSQVVGGQLSSLSSQPGPSGYIPITEEPVVRLYDVTIAVSNFMLHRSVTQTVTSMARSYHPPARPFPMQGSGRARKGEG